MNILPLILALVLMLSVLTIEKLEKYKNQTIQQRQYQFIYKEREKDEFNLRQKRLFKRYQIDLKRLSFRYLLDKVSREKAASVATQFRVLVHDLMKNLYGETQFFKNLEKTRPHLLDELLEAIESAAEAAPKGLITKIEHISRLDLSDTELQEAFYHMLKGSVTREEYAELDKTDPKIKEKAYVSLLYFIHFNGKDSTPTINLHKSTREVLKTIFINDEVVEAVIAKRNELAKLGQGNADNLFRDEFLNKRRPELDDKILEFKITKDIQKEYD